MEKASPENKYHYNEKLIPLARKLRKNMTKAEACLWKYVLKGRTMKGYTFNRQRPVLNYIADFMCRELLLIIEVDGKTHDFDDVQEKDLKRDKALQETGFTVLHFSDWEVLNDIMEVASIIGEWIVEKEKELQTPPV